jgi:hypothetical protein
MLTVCAVPGMACFLRSMCLALSPATPPQPPAKTFSTPCRTGTAPTLDCMDGPPASVTSVLLASLVYPQPLPRSHTSCCSPQVSGAPSQVSNDQVPIPQLHVTCPLRPSAPHFSHCSALLSCYGDAYVPLPCTCVSGRSYSTSFFALNLPRRLAGIADALSGTVNMFASSSKR